MENFGIQIHDDSIVLSDIAVTESTKTMQLFDWQRRAIDYFFENGKAIFSVVTGAGKSFCAIQIMKALLEKNPKMKFLIVVPKNVILERTWFKELYDGGFSLKQVGVFYGSMKEYAQITITNMQSIDRMAIDIFDMIIADEVHNYASERMLEILRYPFKYKLGLSATLERMDDKHYEIMKVFDYNIFNYSPREALDDGILNPFNFTNISVKMDGEDYEKYLELTKKLNVVLQRGGSYKKLMMGNSPLKYQMLSLMSKRKQLVLNYPLKFDVIKEICLKHANDKILIFNEYNKNTVKVYWHLIEDGVKSRVMHSGISHEKRERNLTEFKNDKVNVLCTSKVLDEGYNLPKIDTAIIVAGNSTARQTIQRMGRVLRRKKKVSNLYQIYVQGTMEERYAMVRAKMFKELCHDYKYVRFSKIMQGI